MSPDFVTPEMENRRQSRYAMLLLAFVALILAATAYLTADAYRHPTPAADCTLPEDYVGTCSRALDPAPSAPPGPVSLYLGTLAAAILALVLVKTAWSASVTHQVEIVTSMSGTTPAAAKPDVASTPVKTSTALVARKPLPPLGPHQVEAAAPAALKAKAPVAIVDNAITPDMIAPPKAEPKKGVDASKIGGAK